MKRIALCLSGQMRSIEQGFQYFNDNLLSKFDVDVFIHSDFGTHDRVIELYKPKGWKFTKRIESSNLIGKYTKVADQNNHPNVNTYNMFHSIWQCNNLKINYELENEFKYDVVIKTRTDYALNKVLDFNIKEDIIYVPDTHQRPERNFVDDQFAFGTSEVMDRYCSTFINMDRLYRMGFIMNGEQMLSGSLQINGLVGYNLEYINTNPPFPPGFYGRYHHTTWHNLIR